MDGTGVASVRGQARSCKGSQRETLQDQFTRGASRGRGMDMTWKIPVNRICKRSNQR